MPRTQTHPRTETVQTGTTDGTPPPTFDWDAMLPAVDAPAPIYQAGVRINVRTDVPGPIRARLEESLAQSVKVIQAARDKAKAAGKDPEKAAKEVPPQWKLQPVASEQQGEALVKLMTRYASYRPGEEDWGEGLEFYVPGSPVGQITVRRGLIRYVPDGHPDLKAETNPPKVAPEGVSEGWYVRYAAKPLETRNAKK